MAKWSRVQDGMLKDAKGNKLRQGATNEMAEGDTFEEPDGKVFRVVSKTIEPASGALVVRSTEVIGS